MNQNIFCLLGFHNPANVWRTNLFFLFQYCVTSRVFCNRVQFFYLSFKIRDKNNSFYNHSISPCHYPNGKFLLVCGEKLLIMVSIYLKKIEIPKSISAHLGSFFVSLFPFAVWEGFVSTTFLTSRSRKLIKKCNFPVSYTHLTLPTIYSV